MMEREADLAIVVGGQRRLRTIGRQHQGSRRSRRKRQLVMVPGEEHRLEKERENAESRFRSARPTL